MDMGTIKVTTEDGAERDVPLADILKERRSGGAVASFQTKVMWTAATALIGSMLWLGLVDKVREVDDLKARMVRVEIVQAEQTARSVEQYTQIIRDVGELKTQVAQLAKEIRK